SYISLVLRVPCFCCFFFSLPVPHPVLHSFPTRRSSDLRACPGAHRQKLFARGSCARAAAGADRAFGIDQRFRAAGDQRGVVESRSEEHTSELQSHLNLVCRLLLEKKKQKNNTTVDYKFR